jgi:hypothetical protein
MAAGDFGHGHELAAMRVENEAMSGQVHGRKCSRIVLYMRRNAFQLLCPARFIDLEFLVNGEANP